MAVIPAFQLSDTFEPKAVGVVIQTVFPAGVIVYKGGVIAAPSQNDLSVNPTTGYPTTG